MVLAAVLAFLGFAGWCLMFWMPLKSYNGPWIPLSPEETALRDALRRDVRFLAEEIGDRNWLVYPRLRSSGGVDRRFSRAGRLQRSAA